MELLFILAGALLFDLLLGDPQVHAGSTHQRVQALGLQLLVRQVHEPGWQPVVHDGERLGAS